MTTGVEIGLGLLLNIAFWIAVIGGVACLAAWALIGYGPSARPMKARGRAAGAVEAKAASRGAPDPASSAQEAGKGSIPRNRVSPAMPFDEGAEIRSDEPRRAA